MVHLPLIAGALSYVWSPVDSLSNPAIPYPNVTRYNIIFTVAGADAGSCAIRLHCHYRLTSNVAE